MKKYMFLTLGAAVLMTACTKDDFKDWAAPMSNETPEATATLTMSEGGTVTPETATIDFANFTTEQTTVKVCTFSPAEAKAGVTKGDDFIVFDDEETYQLTNGEMQIADLKSFIEKKYGKAPTERTINAYVYTTYSTEKVSVRSNSGKFELKAKLVAPFIDNGYYLTGDFAGWNKEGALVFTHIGDDNNLYDNPEFQIVFTTTAENQYWKIISKTNYDNDFWAGGTTGVVGTKVDGDTSAEGLLTTDNPQAGKIEAAGIYRMTINMMEYTYKIEKLDFTEFIYVPGNAQKYNTSAAGMPDYGWTPGLAPALRSANFDGKYEGFAYMDGEFKFTKERDWEHGEYNYDSFTSYDAIFSAGGGGNINCAEPGYYKLVADVASGSLKATKLTWGLVGPATAGGWDAPSYTTMTYNMADDCWEVTTDLKADEFKFTTNGSWDINLGGSVDDLSEGGSNLSIAEAGNYTIKLYPSRTTSDKMYCTIKKN